MTNPSLWGMYFLSISPVVVQFVGACHLSMKGSHNSLRAAGYAVWMLALGVVNTGMKLIRELDNSISSIVEPGCGTSEMAPPRKLFLIAPGPEGCVKVFSAPVSDRFKA